MKDDKLFGRGGADDGYAMFASLAALLSLRDEKKNACALRRSCIEACEESGSYDLPFYIEHLSARIGTPDLVVCLDSGCGNYDQLWLTTSLRGIAMGNLTVRVLTEGVHSGDASGIVPSSFRICAQPDLAHRGRSHRPDEAGRTLRPGAARPHGTGARSRRRSSATRSTPRLPLAGGTKPMAADLTELILNRTWRPQLAVTGDGRLSACRRMAATCCCPTPPPNSASACRRPAMRAKATAADQAGTRRERAVRRARSSSMPTTARPVGTRRSSRPGSKRH